MGGVIEIVASYASDVASPCVNICVMDLPTGWCRGCGRTIEEIAGWGAAAVEERRAVLAALPGRMAALGQFSPR